MKIKKTRLIQIIREEISSYRKENLKEISGLATAARGAKQKGYVSPKTKKAISTRTKKADTKTTALATKTSKRAAKATATTRRDTAASAYTSAASSYNTANLAKQGARAALTRHASAEPKTGLSYRGAPGVGLNLPAKYTNNLNQRLHSNTQLTALPRGDRWIDNPDYVSWSRENDNLTAREREASQTYDIKRAARNRAETERDSTARAYTAADADSVSADTAYDDAEQDWTDADTEVQSQEAEDDKEELPKEDEKEPTGGTGGGTGGGGYGGPGPGSGPGKGKGKGKKGKKKKFGTGR